ncbi:DUF6766 family protein [Streptomyces sp. NPDC058646]|uniref:DUF6766 family protein n=1 Tax=Streptomyces sp. NPDC058646 TaxID=3346574 RepID=UPI00365D0E5D
MSDDTQGKPRRSGYVTTSDFAVDVSGNGQAERLAVAAVVMLSVHLRRRGSPAAEPGR